MDHEEEKKENNIVSEISEEEENFEEIIDSIRMNNEINLRSRTIKKPVRLLKRKLEKSSKE